MLLLDVRSISYAIEKTLPDTEKSEPLTVTDKVKRFINSINMLEAY